MKYARLSLQDLKDLEKEFIEFLVINGISAQEWEKLKANDLDKAEKIIDQFSDVVWEGILRKHHMVEKRSSNKLTLCRADEKQLHILYLHFSDTKKDYTQTEEIKKALTAGSFQMEKQSSPLTGDRNKVLFTLINAGFFLTKEEIYEKLF